MAEQKIIRKTYEASETKAAEGEDRTLVVTISTANPDRSNDVVVPKGMISDNYDRNPVVAAFHRYDQPAIGKTIDLQQTDNGIVAKVQFLPKGIYPLADQLYEMYKGGFMSAWSIGLIPKESVDLDPDRPYSGGHRFEKWELLEYSAVLVPDNPDALTMLRGKGIEVEASAEQTHVVAVDTNKELADSEKATKELEQNAQEKPVEEVETKEGRVLSGANRKKINDAVTQMKSAIEALEALIEATQEQETPGEEAPAKVTPNPDHQSTVLPLVEALKMADKVIGKALRNVNERANKDN